MRNTSEVIMKKLLKLSLRIAALPFVALLLAFQLIGSILVGMSSIVTNLLATLFLIGSIAGSIAGASSSMICQTVGLGVFFALAPHIASWLLDRTTSFVRVILDFLLA